MGETALRIALPQPTSDNQSYNERSVPQYIRSIAAAGGTAVSIPLRTSSSSQREILRGCAGVLLPGSPADVDPARFGENRHPETAAVDEAREAFDSLALEEVYARRISLLGICYGLQSLNVWKRGSLIQHLPNHFPTGQLSEDRAVDHDPGREVRKAHSVLLTQGSRLAQMARSADLETPEILVNSSHHQALSRIGEGLRVVAVSPVDGVIEAVEDASPEHFVVAVQWHPERSGDYSATSRNLFGEFIRAAEARRPAGR